MKQLFVKNTLTLFVVGMSSLVFAQNDTVATSSADSALSRMVVVERDYQPEVEQATKLSISPSLITYEQQLSPVIWSTYSPVLSMNYNLRTLRCAQADFGKPLTEQGCLLVAGGYTNTLAHLLYSSPKKNDGIAVNLQADHQAMWGVRTLSDTKLKLLCSLPVGQSEFYFSVAGQNNFYNRYGRYWDGANGLTVNSMRAMNTPTDWQNIWKAGACIGIRSRNVSAFSYRFQTGYAAYMLPTLATEHQVRTHLDVAWNGNGHQAGLKLMVQNLFYSRGDSLLIDASQYNARHAFRIEPFYAYRKGAWSLHAGVNIDLNIGKGQMLSSSKDISFAPSPNIQAEWTMPSGLLNVYSRVEGKYGAGSMEDFVLQNRYLTISATSFPGLTSHHVSGYTPVDATLGIRIRPLSTLLLDVYGRYAVLKNQYTMLAPSAEMLTPGNTSYMTHLYTHRQQAQAGMKLHYHFKDIIVLNVGAAYIFNKVDSLENGSYQVDNLYQVYDQPSWKADVSLRWNIDKKWSVYTENYFIGSRQALVLLSKEGQTTTRTLRPIVELNIGATYTFNRWLMAYLQVDNLLNSHHDIWYGYQSQGIHFLAGIKWNF